MTYDLTTEEGRQAHLAEIDARQANGELSIDQAMCERINYAHLCFEVGA